MVAIKVAIWHISMTEHSGNLHGMYTFYVIGMKRVDPGQLSCSIQSDEEKSMIRIGRKLIRREQGRNWMDTNWRWK